MVNKIMIAQFQVINKILGEKDFSIVILNNLDERFFFNCAAEFKYLKKHYDTFKSVPDLLTFQAVFPEWEYFEVKEPVNFLLDQLSHDYKKSYLANTFNKIKGLVENDKVDEATHIFETSLEDMRVGSPIQAIDILTDHSRLANYLERTTDRSKYYISTGFKELDDIIGGIDRENENMVIAARTGIGKTNLLLKMATESAKQGLKVGIYEGEMTPDKVGYRIDTYLGHIDNTGLNRGDPSVAAQYKKYLEGLGTGGITGSIKVITPAQIAGPVTVDVLRTFVEREHLDSLYVDQYSLLEDMSRSKSSWERVGNISKDIKNLQVTKCIPIISVTQMNRTKNEDDEQDTTQIGLADRIGQDATVVLMLARGSSNKNKDDKDKEKDLLYINIVKSRDGGDNRKLTYKADFNYGKFIFIPENQSAEDAKKTYDEYDTGDGVF